MDVSGRFQFDDLPWGTYDVTVVEGSMENVGRGAARGSRELAHVALAPDTEDAVIVLAMRRPAALVLVVRDGLGSPLAAGSVLLRAADPDDGFGCGVELYLPFALEGGRLEVPGVDVPLWAQVEPLPEPGVTWARQRLGPIAPGSGPVEVVLEPGYAVAGRVVGPEGDGLPGLAVSLWPDETPRVFVDRGQPLAVTRSDAAGAFDFDRIPAGKHWLAVRPPEGFGDFEPALVDAGAQGVVLRLHRRVHHVVRVVGGDGRPLAGANVACREPPWWAEEGHRWRTDADGIVKVSALDPEKRYVVAVTPPQGAVGYRRLVVEDWEPAETTFTLPTAGVVRGRVVDAEGRPVGPVTLDVFYEDPPACQRAASGYQGEIEVQLLRDEPVRIEARGVGGTSDPVQARPGDTDVVLVVAPRKGALRLQVEDWPRTETLPGPGHPHGASFACWPLDAPTQILRGVPTSEGLVEVDGLVPNRRYACLVRNLAHPDVVAYAGDVPADGELHRVPRSPVVPIRGRVVLPEGFHFQALHVVEGDVDVRQLGDGDRYEAGGMPSGHWRVLARAWRRGEFVAVEVVTDGESVPDIVFGGD
jgi:hypothetical protein